MGASADEIDFRGGRLGTQDLDALAAARRLRPQTSILPLFVTWLSVTTKENEAVWSWLAGCGRFESISIGDVDLLDPARGDRRTGDEVRHWFFFLST